MSSKSHRFLVPEVVQTSAMDCGPACLAALLSGFEIPANYDRLRELCQTSIDGTSIDEIEATALQLGLPVEQVMIPRDHLFLTRAETLPAILVVSTAHRSTHFIVVWRRFHNRVLVMDPAFGRRLPKCDDLLEDAYLHTQSVPAEDWVQWAETDDFVGPLGQRLEALTPPHGGAAALIDSVRGQDWRSWGALDAAIRMTTSLVDSGALEKGPRAWQFLTEVLDEPEQLDETLPEFWWTVRPDPGIPENLLFRGVVLVRVLDSTTSTERSPSASRDDLAAVTATPHVSPLRRFVRLLRGEESAALGVLGLNVALAAMLLILETILFRGLLDLQAETAGVPERLEVLAAALILVGLGIALRLVADSRSLRIGLRVESTLRMRLLTALPRLHDRFLRSRPVSDMAQRAHEIHQVRNGIQIASRSLRGGFEILFTAIAMMILHPAMAPVTAIAALAGLALPLMAVALQSEADLRVRTHEGALSRFLYDSLVGLTAVRSHRAEASLHRQQDPLLSGWAESRLTLERIRLAADALQLLLVLSLVVVVVINYLATSPRPVDALLLAYWGLELAIRCRRTVDGVRLFAQRANTVARILEPLEAASTSELPSIEPKVLAALESTVGKPEAIALDFEQVEVRAGGHTVLQGIELRIEPGEHVAIVGPSGAGKTSLIHTILGWHRPHRGSLRIDGREISPEVLNSLRRRTAWVDPSVQLWNRSLLDNLRFGARSESSEDWNFLLQAAEIQSIVGTLPDGLQSPLGESGLALSGGEAQRVRFGRALLREPVALVLLDEAFRGLGRSQRERLLLRAREHWHRATLVCITHDVQETSAFDRVLVLENGTLVEDGSPSELLARPDSAYASLLADERAAHRDLWSHPAWDRWSVRDGAVTPTAAEESSDG